MAKSNKWLQKVEKELRIAKEKNQISEDVIELVNELKFHQEELETKNKELKNSKEALSNLFNQYKSLYDKAPVGYFTLNNEGLISNVNIKGIKLLQLQKNEIIGHGFSHFIHKKDEEKYFFALFKAIAGNNQELEIRLKRNHNYFYAFVEIMPLYEDDETYRIILMDITDHKNAEEKIKENEERYETIFESMTEAFMIGKIILKDGKVHDWRYITINNAAASGYGMKPEQVQNKTFRQLFPDIEPPYLKEIGKALLNNKIVNNKEMKSPITGNWLEIDIYPQKENTFAVFTRTINERKKTEEALNESENNFKTILEAFPEGAFLIDTEGHILVANEVLAKRFGKDLDEIAGLIIYDLLPKEVAKNRRNAIKKVIKTKKPIKYVDKRSGKHIQNYVHPILDKKGKVSKLAVTAEDITERKRIEEALKKSEEKSRLLIKYAPSMIYEIDFRGPKFISVNDVMCSTLGYTREELLAMDPFDILEDESKNILKGRIDKYLAGEEIADTVEYTGRAKNGRIIYGILNMKFTYEDNKPIGAVVVAHDITELKKAEMALKRSEEWFRTVVDTSPGLLVILDDEGKFTYVSPNAEKMTGYTPQEIIKKEEWFVHPNYKTQLQRLFESALKTRSGHRNIEYESVKKNGEVWWTELSSKPIYDEKGNFNGFVVQLFDITKRKEAEMELNKAYMYNRGLIETSLDPMVFIGSDGKIIDSNRATEKITGYSRTKIIGSDFSNYFVDPKQAKKGYIKAFKDGYVRDYDLEIKNKDGNIIPVSYNASTYKDENNEVVGVFAAARDMTEIRKTQKALKNEHDLLQAIIDSIPVMITIFDPFKMKFQVNKELERITGWTNEDAQNKDLMEKVYPDPEYREKVIEYVYSLEPGFRDLKMVAKNGTIIDTTWANVRIPDGRYVGIALDIRDRKKTLEALKESEEKFRALADSSPAAIGVYQDNKIVYANPASELILGYSKEDLFKMDWLDIAHPDYKKTAKNAIKARMTGIKENAHNELKIITKGGEEKWLDVSSNIIQFEGSPAAILIGTDITERKIMEEAVKNARDNLEETVKERTKELKEAYNALRDSEAHLRIAMDMAKLVSWEYDVESDIFTFDDDFYALYGTTAKKEGGTKMSSEEYARRFIPTKEAHLVGEEIAKALETDDPNFMENIEHSIIRDDGEKRYINVRFGVIKDEKGQTIKTYGSNQDITEIKQVEMQLKQIIQELERSNEELQSFAYITSHDLQEPLRTMSSYAGLLKRRYEGHLDEDADDFLNFMVSGAQRMKDMIQGLLDYSRVGTKGEEFKEFNAEDALKIALNNLKSAIEEHQAEIIYEHLPLISADKEQISRVFQNLIGNALKFRKKDITPKIHIQAIKEGQEYIFSVNDNGIGIEEEYSDKIFEVFKRLHAIGKYRGAGIGLAIVKRIIDRHGGRIWVESELGVGSTFYLTVPLKH